MKIRETVTWIPVVTKMTGTMTIQIIIVEAEAWVQEEVSRTKMIMRIMVIQEIGEVKVEIRAEAMVMKMKMIMVQEVLIQEEDLEVWVDQQAMAEIPDQIMDTEMAVVIAEAAIVVVWTLTMAIEEIQVIMEMVDVIPEAAVVVVVWILTTAMAEIRVIMEMADVAVYHHHVVSTAIQELTGEVEAIKDEAAVVLILVIPRINI